MSTQAGSIRNIWAVGRNYSEHAKELNNPVPAPTEEPMMFLKSGTSVVENGSTFQFPTFTDDIHFECEIAFRFGENLKLIELTLAIDLTARDVQSKLKEKQHPWTLAKSFKQSCPIGPLVKIPANFDFENIEFTFSVNGEVRQSGNSRDMIHSVQKLSAYVLDRYPVAEGDLLLTGTPKGVGKLAKGDKLVAEIPGLVRASWDISL